MNTYALFAELMLRSLAPSGRAGSILPTGIATDDTSKQFFDHLVRSASLVSLLGFENERFIFPAVHHAFRFCLLTTAGARHETPADFVFYARSTSDLEDADRHFSLTADEIALLSPNTRTSPTFRGGRDASLALMIYRRVPILLEQGATANEWQVSFHSRLFHMAEDSHLFTDRDGSDRRLLYEAKLLHQFDHRWATYEDGTTRAVSTFEKGDRAGTVTPRWWVPADELRRRLRDRWDRDWLIGWRDITGAEKVRTCIASVLPVAGVGGIHVMFPEHPLGWALISNLNAFVLDWLVRQKIGGTHLTSGLLQQIPFISPGTFLETPAWTNVVLGDWLRAYLAELVVTSDELASYGRELGWTGQPFQWAEDRRHYLRAELDAAFFHLYGLDREDAEHVMDSFWIVRDRDSRLSGSYRTKELILGAYDAMSVATSDSPFVSRLAPPPGDPLIAQSSRPGGDDGRWIPWSEIADASVARRSDVPARAGRTRLSDAVRPSWSARQRVPQAPADSTPVDQPAQQRLRAASDPAGWNHEWLSETEVEPGDLFTGTRIRHRSYGVGTLSSVKPSVKGAELLVRFDAGGDKWIAYGYGVLEFASDAVVRDEPA